MMNNFNPEVYTLVLMAGGMITDKKVEFSKLGFEIFMVDFVRYVQDRQLAIRTDALEGGTYMGDDVPSSVIINEVYNSLIVE